MKSRREKEQNVKVYHGRRNGNGEAEVYVIQDDGRAEPLPVRLDLYNHSPDGFEWGYAGSGPAQLALAILADALGVPAARTPLSMFDDSEASKLQSRVLKLHQLFKSKRIATLDHRREWRLFEPDVTAWVNANRFNEEDRDE